MARWGNSSVWDHLTLVTPPPSGEAGLIVSVADAMQHCRVTPGGIDETQWFIDAIWGAQQMLDGPSGGGVPLLTQQWRLSVDKWPDDYIIVPMVPVQSIDSITYLDLGYNENTLPGGGDPATGAGGQYVYDLDANPVHIRRAFGVVWPLLGIIPGAVKVTFTCGIAATPATWPDRYRDIRQFIKLMVSHYYNHRDAVVGVEGRDSSTPLPLGVDAILDKYRVGRVA